MCRMPDVLCLTVVGIGDAAHKRSPRCLKYSRKLHFKCADYGLLAMIEFITLSNSIGHWSAPNEVGLG